jgi:hypothetical protein
MSDHGGSQRGQEVAGHGEAGASYRAAGVDYDALDGYATELGGATLGEALLEPSVMYVPLVAALLEHDVPVTYLSHITGHGLLKLMRPDKPLRYRIELLPEVPPVLSYLVAQEGMDAQAAYSTYAQAQVQGEDSEYRRFARSRARAEPNTPWAPTVTT